MNWKSTGILLTAAAVLFAFVWLVERPIRKERLRQASRVVLPGFDPASVNSIEIKPRGANEIHVERPGRTNALWQMTQPISYPAAGGPILALLDALAGLEWQDRITARELKNKANAQESYGFSLPQTEVSLQGSGGSQKILIGQTSALGDQVYLEVVGNPDIYLVSAALLQSVPTDKDQWRDLSLLNPAALNFQSIQVRSPGRGFDLERDPTTRLWSMTNKPVTARADNARINELLEQLQGVRVRQFISEDPRTDLESYGLQTSPQTPNLDLTFWQGTNLAAELQVGASPSNQPSLAFARRQNPGNAVVIDREALRPWQGAYTNFLDYHFISTSPDAIGSIVVQGESRFAVEKQTNGQWLVRAATNFPADDILMRDWLACFTNIQTQIEKTVATDLAVYGLKRPLLQYKLQGGGGAGGQSNNLVAQIEFGTNKSGGIFERRPDETFVNLINPDDFNRLPRAAWQLRDRRIWTFESSNVVSLAIHQLGATRKYLRDPEGEWTFAPGSHGPPLVNWPSLEEGVHRLGHLSAVYWSGVGDAHGQEFGFAQKDFSLSLEVKYGSRTETCSIAFGDRSPYSYPYASVVRDGQKLIFEFPVELYDNFVEHDMTIPATARINP
jgi:hypothetical protein